MLLVHSHPCSFFLICHRSAVPQKEVFLSASSQDGHVTSIFKSQFIDVKQCFSFRSYFSLLPAPRRQFWLSQLGEYNWHLSVGKGQVCCYICHNAQDRLSQQRIIWQKKKKNGTNAKIERSCCKLLGLFINTE